MNQNLPAMIDQAANRLIEARSSAEVLEVKAMAEAALHYAKITKAANETHADCVRIITRAEMRMANEIDRGQAAGEIATAEKGRPVSVQASDTSTLDELGIDRRRVAEWRELRDAGEEVVETAITTALSEGRAPTKKEILDAAKGIRAEIAAEKRAERVENIAEISKGNAELNTDQRYPIIYADPPWRYENPPMGGNNRSIENHYPTMALPEICGLPVSEIANDDALLYLWATAPKLEECMRVIEAWGFEYRTCFVWVKDKIGMGYHARNQHELLLVAKRGFPPPPAVEHRVSSVVHGERTVHSAKPDRFYEIIEAAYPEFAKIELFARRPRQGWAAWGNQAEAVDGANA